MLALISLCLFAIAFASEDEESKAKNAFAQYKVTYAKVYATEEEHAQRFQIFKQNADFVKNFDSKARGFTVALNEYADMTDSEFVEQFNGLNITKNPAPTKLNIKTTAPAEWDWRTKGAVGAVKNQGQCGSCWAFSATGAIEGAWFIKHKKTVVLSEQNLVDCSVAQGNHGCNGGLMDQAFRYVIKNKGIQSEASYPYTATGPNPCKFQKSGVVANVASYVDTSSGSESALLEAVYKVPTSVAIDAGKQSFRFYSGGVYNEPTCSSSQLNHGVLAVGYGSLSGSDYWLVKNSWGASWGMKGYILMSRNKKNQCGIATFASYPIAAESI